MSSDEPRAIGWDAIDAAVARVYGDREPKHFGTIVPYTLGGKDPLQGISVYKNTEPLPHFHYVTYGFSELYEKESDNVDLSGYGFELTFRLACNVNDEEPPVWALNFLQNIARYVFSTGNGLAEHHHIDLNGPIALGVETEIRYIALARDPKLGAIDSENGRLTFLQVVGMCGDEYDLVKDWDCGQMLINHVGRQWPLLITDLRRKSILVDAALAADIRALAAQGGSSQGEVFVSKADWEVVSNLLSITIGATAARDVIKLLQSRLMHGRPISVLGPQHGVMFKPDSETAWKTEEALAILSLSPQIVADIAGSLKAERGEYHLPGLPTVVIRVVPSEIKDRDGKVIQVIG